MTEFNGLIVIKHRGIPHEATTLDGIKVYRKEDIYIKEEGGTIKCAPYDNHFIYEEPTGNVGRWSFMCTCGSPAVIVSGVTYKHLGTPSGKMIVCHLHMSTGRHTTGT